MEGAGTNVIEVETALVPVLTLDEETQDKMMKLPNPKVSHTRTGANTTFVAQMDPRRLKLKLENKDDCHTHSCEHCSTFLKIPWKMSSSVKK